MDSFDQNTRVVFDNNYYNFFNEDIVCEKCGTNLNDIRRTGIVGCNNCYKVFSDDIRKMIMRNQGTINHIGQIPSKHFSKVKLKETIENLEKEKDNAIKEENYIAAESIKNQIEKLKGEL